MVKETKQRIVFIGAGNLATHLSMTLQQAGYDVAQVYKFRDAKRLFTCTRPAAYRCRYFRENADGTEFSIHYKHSAKTETYNSTKYLFSSKVHLLKQQPHCKKSGERYRDKFSKRLRNNVDIYIWLPYLPATSPTISTPSPPNCSKNNICLSMHSARSYAKRRQK